MKINKMILKHQCKSSNQPDYFIKRRLMESVESGDYTGCDISDTQDDYLEVASKWASQLGRKRKLNFEF